MEQIDLVAPGTPVAETLERGEKDWPKATAEELRRAASEPAPVNIFDKAMLLSVELHRLGTRKKVKSGAVTTDADAEMIHVSKDLLESKTYEDIVSLDGEIRQYVTSRALPGPFRAGVYLLPNAAVQEVDRKLEAFKIMRARMADKFAVEYPDRARAA